MSSANSTNTTVSSGATPAATASNSNNSNPNGNTSNANNNNNNANSGLKRYALVKWLENSQFDTNNEWFGRLTSVPHSNIIDYEVDDLKAGMEVSVFRNDEVWRAQVIIPKTASNTIDLPPSSQKISKIKTKATAINPAKLSDPSMDLDIDNTRTFVDLNEFKIHEEFRTITPTVNTTTNNALPASANSTSSVSSPSSLLNGQTHVITFLQPIAKSSIDLNSSTVQIPSTSGTTTFSLLGNTNNQANVSQANSNNNSNNKTTDKTSTNRNTVFNVNDMNIETILQMQCELLEQQKELKSIEMETMQQLKQLHENIHRLSRKFDAFENMIHLKQDQQTQNGN
jgi:hypothetical protein